MQADGVSTATAAWVSKRLQFASKNKPEKILIIANKLDTASEFANKVRGFLNQWPNWINVGFSKEKDSQKHFKLNNGCEVKAVATSVDALRGYTPTTLIFIEQPTQTPGTQPKHHNQTLSVDHILPETTIQTLQERVIPIHAQTQMKMASAIHLTQ